ncbi:MAG: M56 family metallopeptidase [Defluviitaleaceae bacterium]|nr:M56 family metallopeptidase [Defluviitaleaceae bacterium]
MHSFMVMLLTCSVVMSLIALLYMAAGPLLGKRYSEKVRYYVWLIILVGLIIPFRPQWGNALIRVDVPSEATQPAVQLNSGHLGDILSSIHFPLTTEVAPINSAVQGFSPTWWQVAFVVWLVGLIAFVSFHLINHHFFIKRVKRWSKSITDKASNDLLRNLKAEMGISRHISLLLCEGIGSPMMLGFAKPKILLHTADLAQDELRFILKHELVHYKRGDLFFKGLVLLAMAIHWFNPVIYVIARAINAQCELSCDAEIVQTADDDTRQQYSEAIIGVVRYRSKFKTVLSNTFYGGRKGMKKRITSIMTTNKKKVTIGGVASAFALASMLTVGSLTAFATEFSQPEPYSPEVSIARHRVHSEEFDFSSLFELVQVNLNDAIKERFINAEGIGGLRVIAGRADIIDFDELIVQERLGEMMVFDGTEFSPRTLRAGNLGSYEFMREIGASPIIGDDGEILMWLPQSFFEMTYEEFNEFAELLTTLIVFPTQVPVDINILREHWLTAQQQTI